MPDNLDEEVRQLTPFPHDLQQAVQELLKQASLHGFTILGMMLKADPPTITAISNIRRDDVDIAKMFHGYAELLEMKAGEIIEMDITPSPEV